ncbi:MAG: hypothetical protein MI724_17980 [Spirochaetales bacterium]|nr:hypothetical protein [Spirochaetales bacterium]
MKQSPPSGNAADAVRAAVEDAGYALVELSIERIKGRTHAYIVLHRNGGLTLDGLTEMHRALQPLLEELAADSDIRVELSSPGIDRVFKSFHEFEIFNGLRVELLPTDGRDWVSGTIAEATGQRCLIRLDDGSDESFSPDTIVKARLTD